MDYLPLGASSLRVSKIGLGCMGMSPVYGRTNDAESQRVLHRFLELGGNLLDTAERYGPFDNEILVGRFLREVPRQHVVIATKFGFRIDPETRQASGIDGSPANVMRACEASLRRLGVETIDLFYQHRIDPTYAIEETVGAMAKLVDQGKVRALGLSEVSDVTLRRAMKVHPIAALQSEYSLWTRDPETHGQLAACHELGVTFVAYSPLGRGFLTGAITKQSDLEENDWRRSTPRFQSEALARNRALVAAMKELADRKQCTTAQVALAWVLSRQQNVVAIPGTKQMRYLEENMAASQLTLTDRELVRLDALFTPGAVWGERYSPAGMASLDRAR
jgi:aryl-alcohol dehydrogenase-like predicted oxidoreductase